MKVVKVNFKKNISKWERELENQQYLNMLVDIMKIYLGAGAPIDPNELDHLLPLAITAWNLANTKSSGITGFNKLFKASMNCTAFSDKQIEMIKTMIKAKIEKYDDHKNLINHYKLKSDQGIPVISLSIQTIEEFALDFKKGGYSDPIDIDFEDDSFEEYDNQEDSDFETGIINRFALLIKPKKPYLELMQTHEPDTFQSRDLNGGSIYLVPEFDSDALTKAWLKKNFDRIFTYELSDFDEQCWPKKRTFKMFNEFFEVLIHDTAIDLVEGRITKF